MIGHILLIALGFILLIKGADFLVEGASKIAKKFNIPEIVIGLTIVAVGTSMPELMVSATSALAGHSDIAIGNVVGSNISNLFLILGICSIIKGLQFKKETRIFENPFAILVTMGLFILGNNGNDFMITKKEGILLLGFCILFVLYNIIMTRKGNQFDGELLELQVKKEEISVGKSVFNIILGIIALKIGGDLVVNHTSQIAQIIGISEKLISLTIVAFSTSLPELITSITATRKGETDLAIGNILGSQIFNILLIIGISSVLNPIQYSFEYNKDLILLIGGSILFALFPYIGKKNEMTRKNGILFVSIYFIYMISLIVTNLK